MTGTSEDPTADRPPEHEPDEDGDAASDVAQFLDVDPPESPVTDADIPAPPG